MRILPQHELNIYSEVGPSLLLFFRRVQVEKFVRAGALCPCHEQTTSIIPWTSLCRVVFVYLPKSLTTRALQTANGRCYCSIVFYISASLLFNVLHVLAVEPHFLFRENIRKWRKVYVCYESDYSGCLLLHRADEKTHEKYNLIHTFSYMSRICINNVTIIQISHDIPTDT